MKRSPEITLGQVAKALDGVVVGDPTLAVKRAVHPREAENEYDLALAMDPVLIKLLTSSAARAAIVRDGMEVPKGVVDGYVRVGRSRFAMAGITKLFDLPVHSEPGIHQSAVISRGVSLPKSVRVGALAYIGPGAVIGAGTVVMPQATIGANVRLGSDCLIHPGARIGERVILGDRVIVHHNASIGADGFSFVTRKPGSVESAKATGRVEATNTALTRINSIGTVILGDDTEVGACTSIDRGTISATRVGRGTKIDDLVMIGHNVQLGEDCLVCGQTGIAGSSVVGDRVVLAGQVGVADNLTIGDDAVVGGGSGVAGNLPGREVYLGTPAIRRRDWIKQVVMLRRFASMFTELRRLIRAERLRGKT